MLMKCQKDQISSMTLFPVGLIFVIPSAHSSESSVPNQMWEIR